MAEINVVEWEPYNRGKAELNFYDRQGKAFSGTQEDFTKEHGNLAGLRNKTTGMIVLINEHGEIAARSG